MYMSARHLDLSSCAFLSKVKLRFRNEAFSANFRALTGSVGGGASRASLSALADIVSRSLVKTEKAREIQREKAPVKECCPFNIDVVAARLAVMLVMPTMFSLGPLVYS